MIGVVLFPYMLANYGNFEVAQDRGSLADVVRTVRYVVKILGDHKRIGIGSDFSGFIAGPRDLHRLGRIHELRDALMAEFTDADMVADIMTNNATRFLAENWGRR